MGNASPRYIEQRGSNLKSSRTNLKINPTLKKLINNYEPNNVEQLKQILETADKCDDISYDFHVFKIFALRSVLTNNDDSTHDVGINQSSIINEYIKLNNFLLINKNTSSSLKQKKLDIISHYAYKATGDKSYNIYNNRLSKVVIES